MPGLISRVLGAGASPRSNEVVTSHQLAERMDRQDTWAGTNITQSTAVTVAAFFAMVRAISEDVGKLPWPVYRREGENGRFKNRATNSPLYRLIHDRPNPWQSSQQFRELLTAHALMRGNGFAFKNIVRGEVRELIPIRPDRVRVEQLDDYTLRYHVTQPGGVKEYGRDEVFHLVGMSLDGVVGVSLVTLARQSLAYAMALERHGAVLFGNKAQPGGAFKHQGELSDRAYERLKDSLDNTKGAEAFSTLLLEEGMDWVALGMSNDDSQFLGSQELSVETIARWGRMPPHKIGSLRRSTFSNIEHQSLEYVQDTLLPWIGRWDNAVNTQVVPRGADVFAEMLVDGLLRGDSQARWNAHRIAINNGVKTPNEVRQLENLNPEEGGDQLFVPAFVTPIELSGQDQRGTSTAPEEGTDARDASVEDLRYQLEEARREQRETRDVVAELEQRLEAVTR